MIMKQAQPAKISFQTGQKIVHGKYTIYHKIGQGQHSIVCSVALKRKGKQIIRAIKAEPQQLKHPQINIQIMVLKSIEEIPGGDIGFTKFYEYGLESDYNYMIMELLGPNLQQLLKLSGGKLTMKSLLIVGLQIVDRLQILHTAGWVYRDIRPQNFVMGLQNKSPIVHMIDFGKCKKYKNKQGTHIPYKENTIFDGQIQFSSVNTHIKVEYSRRDDIQALIYMLIYLRKGKLPWSIAKEFKTRKQRQAVIEQLKRKIPPEHLTFKMPLEFVDLLTYVKTLNFFEKPDYDYIRVLLHRSFDPKQNNLNIVFDWSKMDNLDFAIYTGEPKIVQTNQQDQKQQDINSLQDNQMQSIKQTVSINVENFAEPTIKNKELQKLKETEKQKEKEKEKQGNLFNFFTNFQ